MDVARRRGRRRKKLLDDFKDRRGYSHLKEEALDRTMWRHRFGGGFGPVVRQITKWMSEYQVSVQKKYPLTQSLFFLDVSIFQKKKYFLPVSHNRQSPIMLKNPHISGEFEGNHAWILVNLPSRITGFWGKMKVNTVVQLTSTLAGRGTNRGQSLMRWSFAPNRWTHDRVTVFFLKNVLLSHKH